MYRMTGAGRWRRIFNTGRVKEQVWLMIIWSVYLYIFFVGSQTAIFVPCGKRSDWIFINVFFLLLIYRKRKFCAEPMRERLTFHFELRTRSVNFCFFFSFLLFFLFVFSNQGKISSCNNAYIFCAMCPTPEEGQRTYWLKNCKYNNKDEDNSLNILRDKNYQATSRNLD